MRPDPALVFLLGVLVWSHAATLVTSATRGPTGRPGVSRGEVEWCYYRQILPTIVRSALSPAAPAAQAPPAGGEDHPHDRPLSEGGR